MATRLRESYADLEKKVEIRTRELAQSVEELQALGEVSQAVSSTLDLKTVLHTIVAKAVQISDTDAGTIYVYNEARNEFELRATHGMNGELIAQIASFRMQNRRARRRKGSRGNAYPIQVPDIRRIAVLAAARRSSSKPVTAPYSPFRSFSVRDRIVGQPSWFGARRPRLFPKTTVDLLQTFAARISVLAIQNARLFYELQEKSRQPRASRASTNLSSSPNMRHELRTPLNAILGLYRVDPRRHLRRDAGQNARGTRSGADQRPSSALA